MIERIHAGKPAQITFTHDFHELVTGDLRPGRPVHIRYDPSRIVPEGEAYLFGDPARPIVAHARFRDGDQAIAQPLESKAGVVVHPDTDVTGQGSMLSTSFSVPEEAERVTLWFSYPSAAGDTRYDSDYGANYCFGFPCRQVAVLAATVTSDPGTSLGHFALSVAADVGGGGGGGAVLRRRRSRLRQEPRNSATDRRKRPAGSRRLVGRRPGAAAGDRALQALLSNRSHTSRTTTAATTISRRSPNRTGRRRRPPNSRKPRWPGRDRPPGMSIGRRNADMASPRCPNRGHRRCMGAEQWA